VQKGVVREGCVCQIPSHGYPAAMAEPHVTLGQPQLGPAAEKLRGPLEEQLTSALQRATEVVADEYDGEPVDEVADRLLYETRSALHPDIADAFQPEPTEMRRVAEVIVSRRQPT
jgi:hypothetical protein